MSSLVEHAKQELEMAGLFGDGDFYGGETGKAVMELIEAFSKQGHSGMSAQQVVGLFKELALFRPINPIKGIDEEWNEVGSDVFQNKRFSAVFKDGDGGRPYYLDAIVWQEEGGGCFTGVVNGIQSRQFIKLPFLPKTFYVKIDKDRNIIDEDKLKEAFEYFAQ